MRRLIATIAFTAIITVVLYTQTPPVSGYLQASGDSIFGGLVIGEALFAKVSDKGTQTVSYADLLPEDRTITNLYYPVWTDRMVIFLAQNSSGSYRFLQLTIGEGSSTIKELKMDSGSGGAFKSVEGLGFVSKGRPDEPPLRNPVSNAQTGQIAFLLYEGSQGEKITICVLDPETGEVRSLYTAPDRVAVRSLSWKDSETLIFTQNILDQQIELLALNVKMGSRTSLAKGFSYPTAAFAKGKIAALTAMEDGRQELALLDAGMKSMGTGIMDRQLSKIAWDPSGRFIAVVTGSGQKKGLAIWDSDQGRKVEFASGSPLYYEEVGAIYFDYTPVWDDSGNLYYTVKDNDFVKAIYRFNLQSKSHSLVYDFSRNNYHTISAFAISRMKDATGARQIIICGLKDISSRQRSASLFFFSGPIGEDR